MKKISFFLNLIFLYSSLIAADLKYANYDWEANPKLHDLKAEEKSLEQMVLKDKLALEFAYGKDGAFEEYKLIHKIIRVNSNDAIEQNNHIYIPTGRGIEFVKHKVRVISPGNKVKVLSEADIKEAVDEQSKAKYRFYAVEGIELGSEIEFFYFIKVPARYTGTRERLQSSNLKKNVEFEIISPGHLFFKVKSYNGLPEMKKDTTVIEKNILYLSIDALPGLEKEEQSAYLTNLQQLIYKLDYNSATNTRDIASFGTVSERVYKNMMAPVSGSVKKRVKKLIDAINIKFARDDEDKIKIIDDYLKTHFSILESDREELDNLEFIIDKRITSKEGMAKLAAAIFNEINIDYQVVLTCDREELKFDPDFEAYNFLAEYLFYFPSLNLYLLSYDPISSLGYVAQNYTNNYGLFVKKVDLGSYVTGIGKVKFIEPISYDKNYDNLKVKVEFTPEIINPAISMERQLGGYYAQYYQPYYSFLPEENKKKTTDAIMKDFVQGLELKETKVENEGLDYFGVKPFIIRSTFSSDNFIEQAGNKYLFKIGELIGAQVEMYKKEERKQPVESDFSRAYHREISFVIPEGFKVSNAESLNMDVFMEEKGDKVIAFTSKYSIQDNVFKVVVDEYYKKLSFTVAEFDSYRKVINAAADFNKVSLFLEKK